MILCRYSGKLEMNPIISLTLTSFLILLVSRVQSWNQFGPNWEEVENVQNFDINSLNPAPPAPESFDPSVSAPIKALHDSFFRRLFDILIERGIYYNENDTRKESPFNFRTPEHLLKELDLTLGDDPTSDDQLLKI